MATLEEEQKENHLTDKDQIIQKQLVKIQELEKENQRLNQKINYLEMEILWGGSQIMFNK
jgi:hypothetical protein